MTYNVLFLDIDGTILTSNHTYTEETKQAIDHVKAKGLHVFLATGRPIHEISDLAHELGINAFIGYNGAFASYKNETIVDEPIPRKTLETILYTAKQHGDDLIMYTNGENYYTNIDHPESQNFIQTFQLKHNAQWDASKINDVLGTTLIHTQNPLPYENDPSLRLAPVNVNGIHNCYDVLRKDVHKGEAIKKVLNVLNIPAEQAIAFGDGMNDKEMLQSVGAGFAMGNAHPDLFQYAPYRTATVDESGIKKGLQQIGVID
ncbi:HAD family hydrolase [Lentibacillus saliphilus]|uniref:HAD family hydrolase n=1 Tax=Lentibacillus saliphilus TaxID=2737028 RepID=UPI001C30147D|nr:HAD family hydrolase [Lentibacillus saliphilus]